MLIGEDGLLWEQPLHHELALILAASYPSGHPDIVHVREMISECRVGPGWRVWSDWRLPTIRHLTGTDEFIPIGEIYIGGARNGFVMTPWANPCVREEDVRLPSFSTYLASRGDFEEFLYPLSGKVLVCDCLLRSMSCHGKVMMEACRKLVKYSELEAQQNQPVSLDPTPDEDGVDEDEQVAPHLDVLCQEGHWSEKDIQARACADVPETERGSFVPKRMVWP